MTDPTPPPPVQPTPPPPSSSGGAGQRNTLMIVLSYLYILALVPLLVEKDDAEVQWHAKHGLVLLGIDIGMAVIFTVLGLGTGGLGCLLAPLQALAFLALFIVRIICIVKGVNGERFLLPGISQLADKF